MATVSNWVPKYGDECWFPRGMFGLWRGRIVRVYEARGGWDTPKGTRLVDVAFTGANGRHYTRKRVHLADVSRGGIRGAPKEPAVETARQILRDVGVLKPERCAYMLDTNTRCAANAVPGRDHCEFHP